MNGPCTEPRLATIEFECGVILCRHLVLAGDGLEPGHSVLPYNAALTRSVSVARRLSQSTASDRPPAQVPRADQFAPHDVRALDHRDALIVRDAPAQALAAEAAIGGDDQPLHRQTNHINRSTNQLVVIC